MRAKGRFSRINKAILVLSLGLFLLLSQSCSKRPVEPEPELQQQGDPEPEPEPEPVPPDRKAGSMPIIVQYHQPSNTLSDDDLVEIATRYRAVSDAKSVFTESQMARLREIRPNICIGRYLNFAAIYNPVQIELVLRNHPDWVMRDSIGQPVRSQLGLEGLLMRPNSSGWEDLLVQKATQFIGEGYDGITADEVKMCGNLPSGFTGINTETNSPYSIDEYRQHQLGLVETVKNTIGRKTLVLNNVRRGTYYFQEEPYAFLGVADGVVAEGFRGLPGWPLDRYLTEEAWIDNVEMMLDAQSRQKVIVAVIKFDKDVVNSQERLRDYELFMFTTFLMGMGDSCYYTAAISDPQDPYGNIKLYFDYWEIDLGEPLDPYESNGSHYQREYENARVLVNPTDSPAAVDLGGQFTTLEGEPVSQISMNPHTGTILLK